MTATPLSSILRHVRKLADAQAVRDLTDGDLLARFRDGGEEAAFTLLVQRHGPMVLGVSRRVLHDWHAAEDVFQATFLVLAQKAGSIRKTASVASWLHGVAHRIATKALRRSARSRRRERRAFDMAQAEPLDELTWQELRLVLDEEIAGLPEKYKVPVVLHYLEGKSHEQAARELGWPKTSFSSRLARAREFLRERFVRRGLALPAALLSTALAERAAPAAVSARLVLSTVRGGSLALAGKVAAGGAVSTQAAALAEEAMKAMSFSKLKVILALVLSGGLAATGAGLAARQSSTARPPQPRMEPVANGTRRDTRRFDADGRPLPAGAVYRLGSRRFRIEGRKNGFALPTPDGKYVLVQPQPGLSDYAALGLMLLDLDTGFRARTFQDSRRVPKGQTYDAIRPAAFSPDGKKLYAIGWHKSEEKVPRQTFYVWASFDNPCKRVLLVWDVATGKLTAEWELPPGNALGASLIGVNVSADGKRLYVYGAVHMRVTPKRYFGGVAGVHVLDAATGKQLETWAGAGPAAVTIAGGKELVTFGEGTGITARDAETGKPVRTFPLAGFVSSVALSPDRKTVAAVGMAGHPDRPTSCEIALWEAATGREIRRLIADAEMVKSASARLVFAADGKTLYLGTGSGRILRWDLSNGRALPNWAAHSGGVADLFLRPGKNELVSAGSWDGAIRRWDVATGKALSTTAAYVGEVAVARKPNGKEVAVGDDTGRVDVWDVATGRVTRTLRLPAGRSRQLRFSRDGRQLLDSTGDGKITIRDAVSGKAVREIPAPPRQRQYGGACAITFSPDGRSLFASGEAYGTRLLTWPGCTVVWRQADSYEAAAFSPDGRRMVSGNWNDKTIVRSPKSGAELSELAGPDMASAAFSPDGRRLATAHLYGLWRVRDGSTGAVLKEVKGFQHVWAVAFSPSGWLLAVAGDKSVRVYDTASWQEVARFDGHEGMVHTVFFGPDDATLVSASAEDGTALVWSLKPPAGREPPGPAKLWADLAGDGPAVRRAVWAAARQPDAAIRLFREKWPTAKHPIDAKRGSQLIADLDSPVFARREAATAELEKLGRRAEAALRKELAATASAEVKRRAERILARWAAAAAAEYPPEDARELRAVWALELAGTPEARTLLAEWAAAQVGNRLWEEAAAAEKRLQRKK
ncbi:MAG TPA: sigma-70 family RNA polymerase sigma factor [Gemmataceae bacterium]|nr:sigma-70 family RNA polymerase sigma factor [Gemmataceae bacterium]